MATTSLKLPEELKEKAISAAREMGLSPHAFMVEAIRQATRSAEMRAEFTVVAQAARAEMLESGQGHSPDAVRTYLRKRLIDPHAARPESESWLDSATPIKR